MIQKTTALVLTVFSVLSYADQPSCFDPEKNKTIQTFLAPNQIQVLLLTPKNDENTIGKADERLNEDAATIKKIHNKIFAAYKRYDIDPRLIYGFMIGESQANPFASVTEGVGADKREIAGLFSFRRHILNEVRSTCDKSKQPRLCQLEYYIDQFLPDQIGILDEVCPKKVWKDLSQGEKFIFLTNDSCRFADIAKRKCLSDRKYQNSGACALIQEVFDWNNVEGKKTPRIPLCDDYVNPPPSFKEKVVAPAVKKTTEP